MSRLSNKTYSRRTNPPKFNCIGVPEKDVKIIIIKKSEDQKMFWWHADRKLLEWIYT